VEGQASGEHEFFQLDGESGSTGGTASPGSPLDSWLEDQHANV